MEDIDEKLDEEKDVLCGICGKRFKSMNEVMNHQIDTMFDCDIIEDES